MTQKYRGYRGTKKRYWNCFMRDWEETLWYIQYWHCRFIMGSCKIQNMWTHQLDRKAKDKTLTSQRRKKGQPWPNEITMIALLRPWYRFFPLHMAFQNRSTSCASGRHYHFLWQLVASEKTTLVAIVILQNCLLSQEPLCLEFHIPDFKQCF